MRKQIASGVVLSSVIALASQAVALPGTEPLRGTCTGVPSHVADAAEAGHPDAQVHIGNALIAGACGTGTSQIEAGIRWLEQATASGHMGAHVRLGHFYQVEVATAPDFARSVWHFRIAAQHGYTDAQHRLGLLLLSEGQPYQQEEALFWLGAAASQGDALSAVAMGLVHARGLHGVARDACVALDWYEAGELLGAPIHIDELRTEFDPSTVERC